MNLAIVLACDLGGTNVSAMACRADGLPLTDVCTLPSVPFASKEATLTNIRQVISTALDSASRDVRHVAENPTVQGLGLSLKGPLDPKLRKMRTDAFPQLMDFDIVGQLELDFGFPVIAQNNANCFVLGEAVLGAGKGYSSVLGFNLGTGFGCGIVLDGQIIPGASGNAGELEWCSFDGRKYDDVFSARGAAAFFPEGGSSSPSDSREMGRLARGGDAASLEGWRRYGTALGGAVGKFCALVDPSVLILGGSGSAEYEFFGEALNTEVRKQLAPESGQALAIRVATLGKGAALSGAAIQAANRIKRNG